MANEIQWRGTETGVTLYATIRSKTGTQWNTAGTPNFEAVTAANWTDYDVALAESSGNYFYTGTFPAISGNMVAGWYWVDIYKRAGGSPAITDTLQGTIVGYWDGTSLLPWATDTKTIAGTTQTARDIGASVLLSSGTGAGQISLSSGAVLLQATQTGVTIPTVTTVGTTTNFTNDLSKYANGAVWIDNVNGAAGTTSYTNGIVSNPVTTLADAKTIADNLKMKRFWIQSGSSLTLGAAYDGYIFDGHGYTLALGGRSISGATIMGSENLSGTATSSGGECFVWRCQLGTCSFGEVDFHDCHLMGTITQSQASVPYLYDACIGVSSAKITFAAANQTTVVSNFGGAVTIAGMVSTNTLYIDGDCVVTLDNTNNAGTVYVSGNVRLTNSGTSMTIYYDNNTTKSNSLTFTVAGDLDVNVQSWAGASVATPTVSGVPEVDITYVNGSAASGSSTIDANVVSVSGDATAADNLEAAYDGTGYVGGTIKQKVDLDTIKTQTVTCAAGVTVLASVGTASTSTAQTGDTYALANGASGFVAIAGYVDCLPATLDGSTLTVALQNGSIKAATFATGAITAAAVAASAIGASELGTDAIIAIADEVWNSLTSTHTGIGSFGLMIANTNYAAGTVNASVGAAGAGLTAVPWNTSWNTSVQADCTASLNAYDPPTKAEMDSAIAAIGGGTLTAADIADAVWNELPTGHLDTDKAGAQLWTVVNTLTGGSTVNITTETTVIDSE